MKLFDIVNGEVVLSAECIAIPPFRILWDSHKDKKLAQRKIEYIIKKIDMSIIKVISNKYPTYWVTK